MTTTVNEWAPLTSHVVGDLIVDGNQNIQQCIIAGTTGAKPPQWAKRTIGNEAPTTGDGSVVWSLTGLTALLNPGVGWYFVSA